MNVGTKNDAIVKVMFTTPIEEYFYATFKDVKVKKTDVSKIEVKIRKADSVIVELTVFAENEKQTKALFRQAKKEYGKPQSPVYTSPTAYDWLWNEKKYPHYIESKSFHYKDAGKAEFKMILIPQ